MAGYTFTCKHCGEPLTVPREAIGKRCQCFRCARVFLVPSEQQEAAWRAAQVDEAKRKVAVAKVAERAARESATRKGSGEERLSEEAGGALAERACAPQPTPRRRWIAVAAAVGVVLLGLVVLTALLLDARTKSLKAQGMARSLSKNSPCAV